MQVPEDVEVLRAVFRFKRQRSSATQTEAFCKKLKDTLGEFIAGLVDAEAGESTEEQVDNGDYNGGNAAPDSSLDRFSSQEIASLQRGWQQLGGMGSDPQVGDVWTIAWFPEYASVLQAELFSVDTVALRALALDKWEWTKHFLPDGECVDSAVPTKHVVLSCGCLQVDDLNNFEDKLSEAMAAAKEITGTSRSAAIIGSTGHQRTPQFVVATVRTVLDTLSGASSAPHKPRGGMTDVGLHTGGAARDTCWPLVCAALRQSIPRQSPLMEKVLIGFFGADLESILPRDGRRWFIEEKTHDFWDRTDTCFEILEKIVAHGIELIAQGYDGSKLVASCERWRQALDKSAGEWSAAKVEAFSLHGPTLSSHRAAQDELPKLREPSQEPFDSMRSKTVPGDTAITEEAQQFMFLRETKSTRLLKYLEKVEPTEKIKVQHTLHLIERRLIEEAGSLDKPLGPDEDERELAVILDIVEWYRTEFKGRQDATEDEMTRIEQQSIYAVVCWVAFCLAHRLVCRDFPEVAYHRIALNPQELEVCVVRDQYAREALCQVAFYIQRWNYTSVGQPLFDLTNQEGTLALASVLSKSRPEYAENLGHVQQQWRGVCASMWSTISVRKMQLNVLQQEITSCTASMAQCQQQLKQEEDRIRREWHQNPHNRNRPPPSVSNWNTEVFNQEIYRLTVFLSQKRAMAKETAQMPGYLVCPLPRDTADALQVLFLMAPPWQIDALAGLCWHARSSIAPVSSSTVIEKPAEPSWLEHFEQSVGGASLLMPTSHIFTAFPGPLEIPESFGPQSIVSVVSEEDYIAACVWYPPAVGSRVLWAGASSSSEDDWVNPFLSTADESRSFFTPRLANVEESTHDPHWVTAFPDDARLDRGNTTYAERVGSLDVKHTAKHQIDSLGAIRAYPLQQLRRVFSALEDDVLDLSHPIVAVVLKQALYQVGEIRFDGGKPWLLWHHELSHRTSAQSFCSILGRLVSKLHRSPRRWHSLPLVIEIATFVSQYSAKASSHCSVLASTAREWARGVSEEWQRSTATETERHELRARECLLYGFAILAFDSRRQLTMQVITEMCQLLVLFNHAKMFADAAANRDVMAISVRVERIMIKRVGEIVDHFEENVQAMFRCLTSCCCLVYADTLSSLVWKSVQAATTKKKCFTTIYQAKGAGGQSYAINLLTGAVTSNGDHPSGLPERIRSHATYKRLFGTQDFEVQHREGEYRALQLFNSRQYRFRLLRENDTAEHELLVEEVHEDTTLQLCCSAWREESSSVFPAQLSALYSPWYWRDRRVVLLRGQQAMDTGVAFVIHFDEDGGTARCYEVPRHDRLLPYSVIVEQAPRYPMLIVPDSALLKVFGKFEHGSFIHVMRQPTSDIQISLPRFGLRFVKASSGRITAVGHRGFALSDKQQLGGQMPRFQQYLLLESDQSDAAVKKSRRLLVPSGAVRASYDGDDAGLVQITTPTHADAMIEALAIDEHPRLGVFVPETIESKLQLAAIYAAASNALPWSDLQMTGGEAALELLRGCVPSRPFSSVAVEHLQAIATKFAYRTPVLRLFAALLLEKSRRLGFLHNEPPTPTVDFTDALDLYRDQLSGDATAQLYPVRQRLTPAEECDLFGSAAAASVHLARQNYQATVNFPTTSAGTEAEGTLATVYHGEFASLLALKSSQDRVVRSRPFPLAPHGTNSMSAAMLDELRASWDAFHHNQPTEREVGSSVESIKVQVRSLLQRVRDQRGQLFELLSTAISQCNSTHQERLHRLIGCTPAVTVVDIMKSVLDESTLNWLAPRLSSSGRASWKRICLDLLELCVVEDKLERVLEQSNSSHDLVEELLTTKRAWEPSEYPYWLVFEVEGRLQIRHEQYIVAKHLLDNPGSICQLNMGRGKTRVILPMLFLHYSYSNRGAKEDFSKLVRAHFLSPLLSETRELMWRVLTSGVLALPFVELPFNRSHTLRPGDVRILRHVLREGTRNGVVVMVAPEYRLSLELARVELQRSSEQSQLVRVLDEILEPSQYIDVFDESDALLHHGYHLVYAIGASSALDRGPSRWLAAEALLRVLVSSNSKRVQQVLQKNPDLWSLQPEYRQRCSGSSDGDGVYNGFRLHTFSDGSDHEAARSRLRIALVEDLMEHALFDFEWLRVLSEAPSKGRGKQKTVHQLLIQIITDPTVDAEKALAQMSKAARHVQHHILALRGLVAFGVLENGLEKRYRVEYGHSAPGTRRKALAIPYQAADLPTERSEFSHPDVGIVLTLLAFYHSGLTDAQIRRSFEVLLSLDDSESAKYYDEWFASLGGDWKNPEEHAVLAKLAHISMENTQQFALVCGTYRYAVEVINFYVNFCVFPSDTRQFPYRMSRSAWDLVRGPSNIGFSGTNDTHHLLPLGVKQREPDDPLLRGTNGKMIQLLLDATTGYEALSSSADELTLQKARWQLLLDLALEKGCHAVIDTGALLAGVSNHEAAQYVLTQPGFTMQGVTYYDTRPQFDAWMVVEKDRSVLHYHKNSSLRESDTFVLFDEARARGSDMKLLPQAAALLTLGPTLTKDKLMQGAGRLRQLGKDQQTLWLTSTEDVYKRILRQRRQQAKKADASVNTIHVLNWVLDNTQRQCTLGLLEWAQSGMQFYAKEADSEHEFQADDWTLDGLYASAQTDRLLDDVVKWKLAKWRAEAPASSGMLAAIAQQSALYGRQDMVRVSNFDEECERELQIEEEQQDAVEANDYQVTAVAEAPWNWDVLLGAASIQDLAMSPVLGTGIWSLQDAAFQWFLPLEISQVAWAATNVYGTTNFWATVRVEEGVATATAASVWNRGHRQVHAMLVFADTTVLLLSEFEEHVVLKMIKDASSKVTMNGARARWNFALVHLPFVVGAVTRMEKPLGSMDLIPLRDVPLVVTWPPQHGVSEAWIPFIAVITSRLLNGDTNLFLDTHPVAAGTVLGMLLSQVRNREDTLQAFIAARGHQSRWKRSLLHALAKRMDLMDVLNASDRRGGR